MIIEKAGQEILTLEDWHRLAPPKSPDKHWVDLRSAKETARAWLTHLPDLPPEIRHLFSSHTDLAATKVARAEPEGLLRFDGQGGPRNADLVLWATDARGPISITIEAKADESFDQQVSRVFSKALENLIANPRSGGVTRILQLAKSLFGPAAKGDTPIGELRYQLLTATAATVAHAAAIGAERAVLVVHEFVSTATSQRKLSRNHDDLEAFVRRLSKGSIEQVEPQRLYGPLVIPGKPLFDRPAAFYIGKAVRHLGEPRP